MLTTTQIESLPVSKEDINEDLSFDIDFELNELIVVICGKVEGVALAPAPFSGDQGELIVKDITINHFKAFLGDDEITCKELEEKYQDHIYNSLA